MSAHVLSVPNRKHAAWHLTPIRKPNEFALIAEVRHDEFGQRGDVHTGRQEMKRDGDVARKLYFWTAATRMRSADN